MIVNKLRNKKQSYEIGIHQYNLPLKDQLSNGYKKNLLNTECLSTYKSLMFDSFDDFMKQKPKRPNVFKPKMQQIIK